MKSFFLITLFFPFVIFGQTKKDTSEFNKFTSVGFTGLVHTGLWGGTVPAHPEGEGVDLSYTGFGFGIDIDYHVSPYIGIHFDIRNLKRKTPIAYNGGYATSDWVWEMTNYNQRLVGPFDEDVDYIVNSTTARLGIKFYPLKTKKVSPWVGLFYSYSTYNLDIYSSDKLHTYGKSSGDVWEKAFYNFGVDFWDTNKSVAITLFVELSAPVARDFQIEDCLVDGWVFQDYGEGTHLYGYNRFGISINMNAFAKK